MISKPYVLNLWIKRGINYPVSKFKYQKTGMSSDLRRSSYLNWSYMNLLCLLYKIVTFSGQGPCETNTQTEVKTLNVLNWKKKWLKWSSTSRWYYRFTDLVNVWSVYVWCSRSSFPLKRRRQVVDFQDLKCEFPGKFYHEWCFG